MALIITATDFSDVATNAVNYACGLAMTQRAQVVVIHSFMVPVVFSDIPMPTSVIADAEKDAEIKMNELVTHLTEQYTGLQLTGKIIYGDTIDVIDEYTDENNTPMLVVIGNDNAGEGQSTWPDSTLVEALKLLKHPVLAIPVDISYKPVQKICFAFDNKHAEIESPLAQLKTLTALLQAQLFVLNLQEGERVESIDRAAVDLLSAVHPDYEVMCNVHDIDAAITTYSATHNIDWLAMIPHKHSFFESMFHKSHTRAIAHSSHLPILAIHQQ